MTIRTVVFAISRALSVIVAFMVIALTLGYVAITSPFGNRWFVRAITEQAKSSANVTAEIGGLDTDIFTYVLLRRVNVALPDSGATIGLNRLQLRMSLWRLLMGRVSGIRRISADSLIVTVPLKPDTSAPFEWSISPYLPYVPADVDIRGLRVRLTRGEDTTSFSLKAAQLRSIPDETDSSLYADLSLTGEVSLKQIGTIPFVGKTNLLFRNASVRIGNIVVSGPGILGQGHGYITDVMKGPYKTSGSLQVDLSQLPRRASGLEIAGNVAVKGDIGWDTQPRLQLTLEAPTVATPWVSLSNTTLYLNTSDTDSTVSLRGASTIAEGSVGISATMVVPPKGGPVSIDFAAVDVLLDSVARIPAVKQGLAGTALRGVATVRWQYSADATLDGGFALRSQRSRAEITTRGLQYADMYFGKTALAWDQIGNQTLGSADVAGTHVNVRGTADGIDKVALSADVRTPRLDSLLHVFGIDSLGGDLDVHTTINGSLRAPNVGVSAVLRNPKVPSFRLADLTLNASITRGDTVVAHLSTADSLIKADAVVTGRFTRFASLRATVGPLPFSEIPGNIAGQYDIAGSLNAELIGAGAIANPYLRGQVRTTPITWHGQNVGIVRGGVVWFGNALTLDLHNGDDTFTVEGSVATDSGATSRINVQWGDFDLGAILAALMGRDLRQVAGMSDGTISATWKRLVPNSFTVQARVEKAQVRLGETTYNLANPPARFVLEDGLLTLTPTILQGSQDQRLHMSGSVKRSGEMDFTAALDSFDVGNVVSMATSGEVAMQGKLVVRAHVGGTIDHPIANGRIAIRNLKWRAVDIDSIGAVVSYASDLLRVSDFRMRFPFGEAHGAFTANSSALGIVPTDSLVPNFVASLSMTRVGALIPNWEGLRSGTISVSGQLDLVGDELGNIASARGTFRLDTLAIVAPFSRAIRTLEPATFALGDSRYLRSPLKLGLTYRDANAGTVSISQPGQGATPPLVVGVDQLSLEDLSHVLLPLLKALDVTALPDDLSGALTAHATWNLDVDNPDVQMDLIVREPTAYAIIGDSLDCVAAYRQSAVLVETANFYSAGDTLNIQGFVDLGADSVFFHAYTRRLELVPVLADLLPPLRTYQPPPPLPTTMPFPGYMQQLRYLPPEPRGAHINAPLTIFDRLVRQRGGVMRHPYAATLPLDVEIEVRGKLNMPLIYGQARVLGAYVEVESLVEPIWVPDTLNVRISGTRVIVDPVLVYVGTQTRENSTPPSVSLERAEYSLMPLEFDMVAGIDRATFTVISTESVVVPARWRWLSWLIEPALRAYYTEPVGGFTTSARVGWKGTTEYSTLTGDVKLYSSTLQFPIADPQAVLKPLAPTSLGPMLDNAELFLTLSTEDSLQINNNLSTHASLWTQMTVTGHHYSPNLQGRVEVSPGSVFRYLGRDFVVQQASMNFPDPTRFEPEIDITAHATVGDANRSADPTYDVTLVVSGVLPNKVKTEFSAEEQPSGEVIVSQLEIMQIMIYGRRSPDYLAIDAQGRLNNMLKERGYATLSTALGRVLPIDQVIVRESATSGAQQGGGMNEVEVEMAQNFHVLGQNVTLSAVSPVGQLSSMSGLERAEARWMILERPPRWPLVESLSFTVGQNRLQQTLATSDLFLQNELTSGLQLRVRFR